MKDNSCLLPHMYSWVGTHDILLGCKSQTQSRKMAIKISRSLYWLSLVPASTAWAGDHPDKLWPAVIYGAFALMAGVAYYIMVRFIIRANHGADIEKAIGGDFKGVISIVIYASACWWRSRFPSSRTSSTPSSRRSGSSRIGGW